MHQCSASIHRERGGGERAEDDVYVTILTPFVHMEKAWNVKWLDVRRELSLRGSDCKMNPEFDFCVTQASVIIYVGVCVSAFL